MHIRTFWDHRHIVPDMGISSHWGLIIVPGQEVHVNGDHLTHFILNRLYHTIYWKSPISILGTSGYEIYKFLEKNG